MAPKGDPDPRTTAQPVEAVPTLLAKGAAEFNAQRYWHAHEDWEEAWHALRAAGRTEAADFLQGMILVTAGFENARRGKPRGFRRQTAKGLLMMRRNRAEADTLGVADADAWVAAVTDVYLDACSHLRLSVWADGGVLAPPVRLKDA